MEYLKKIKWFLFVSIFIFSLIISIILFGKAFSVAKLFLHNLRYANTIHKSLKKVDIPKVSDEELVSSVMDWMWGKIDDNWSNEYEVITAMPKACQNIYSVFTIEAEVNNGGFNQCYYNSSKKFTTLAESGFKEIGADGFADIMIRANLMYSEIKDELNKYNDGTLEGFSKSYENNPLNKLDDEFVLMYDKESLHNLCVAYIRENAEYFGD